MDCGAECGHCESCLPFAQCMTTLESYGEVGLACAGPDPVACLDTCSECQPCADHLWCLDAINDENCYSEGALACLEDLEDCQHCLDNPFACTDAHCLECEPYQYCLDVVADANAQ